MKKKNKLFTFGNDKKIEEATYCHFHKKRCGTARSVIILNNIKKFIINLIYLNTISFLSKIDLCK